MLACNARKKRGDKSTGEYWNGVSERVLAGSSAGWVTNRLCAHSPPPPPFPPPTLTSPVALVRPHMNSMPAVVDTYVNDAPAAMCSARNAGDSCKPAGAGAGRREKVCKACKVPEPRWLQPRQPRPTLRPPVGTHGAPLTVSLMRRGRSSSFCSRWPRRPYAPEPHVKTWPSPVRATACTVPHAMSAMGGVPAGNATGIHCDAVSKPTRPAVTMRSPVAPLPSTPFSPVPHANTRPLRVSASEKSPPQPTCAGRQGGTGGAGGRGRKGGARERVAGDL
jgi:hypothetical protein